jgi:hypothetical protein
MVSGPSCANRDNRVYLVRRLARRSRIVSIVYVLGRLGVFLVAVTHVVDAPVVGEQDEEDVCVCFLGAMRLSLCRRCSISMFRMEVIRINMYPALLSPSGLSLTVRSHQH